MFIDEIKIYAKAGHGGAGCVAFSHEAYRPKGGPSGGNGGRGGNVILEASHDLNNLIAQFFKPRLISENGRPGQGKQKTGRSGKNLIIKVPCGTVVWHLKSKNVVSEEPVASEMEETGAESEEIAETVEEFVEQIGGDGKKARVADDDGEQAIEFDLAAGEETDDETDVIEKELVVDMLDHGQQFVLCTGGRGGRGNMNFASARQQVPRFAQPGEPGDEGHYLFELQIMAEVGLVGYPNAGKSTLLTAISAARPKVAPYPFTTLHPQIGVLEFPDYFRMTICDVPGIIEGAHNNVGLGHKFLRHIERCKVLVYLIDMAGTDGRKPWDDFNQLQEELRLYDENLVTRPMIVVANKMDEDASTKNLRSFKRKFPGLEIMKLSAAFDIGIEDFKNTIRQTVEELNESV